jgi:ubiquinol-cytochrome c reductase cytochrome b subunit
MKPLVSKSRARVRRWYVAPYVGKPTATEIESAHDHGDHADDPALESGDRKALTH